MNALDAILLRREGLVFVAPPDATPTNQNTLSALETEVLALGFTLSQPLRQQLEQTSTPFLESFAKWLLPQLRAQIGAPYAQPLFRQFPKNIPKDTWRLYVQRVLVYHLQQPEQPCLLCGKQDSVHPLNPCGHLVCRDCWDGSNYSGCPICHRHIDASDPFLKPAPPREKLTTYTNHLTRLELGQDREVQVEKITRQILQKTTPLSPQEKADLLEVIKTYGATVLAWLPERIAIKETMALCLGNVLRDPRAFVEHKTALEKHLKTATDVLRLLAVRNGEDGSLSPVTKQTRDWIKNMKTMMWMPDSHYYATRETYLQNILAQHFPKQKSLPRAARRGLLGMLDQFALPNLLEDMKRYPQRWKRAGEMLHPLEYQKQFPKVALAFSLLRGQQKLEQHVKDGFKLLENTPNLAILNEQYYFFSWGNRTNYAFANNIVSSLPSLLSERPGEFGRRLDHALRLCLNYPSEAKPLLEAFFAVLPKLTTPMLLQLQAHFSSRGQPLRRRVFFPKGEVLLSYSSKDTRATLPQEWRDALCDAILSELLTRAAKLPTAKTALLDADLQHLFLPQSERSSSKALIALPRGSRQLIPQEHNIVRLFMHWMQREPYRVDLDLSFSFFDAQWKFLEGCDFTNLSARDGAYIHSGDWTDAPAPDGASEYIDLNLELLKKRGIRYCMMIVFSYNSVPFDQMPFALAGVMQRTDSSGEIFEPRTVQNRFDLSGNAQIAIPLYLDLQRLEMQWLDIKLTPEGVNHQVMGYHKKLGAIGKDFQNYYASGTRPTLWQLACLHAAARASTVQVRTRAGVEVYTRGESTPLEFYWRIIKQYAPESILEQPSLEMGGLAYLVRRDLELPPSEVYALYWQDLPSAGLEKKRISDLVDAFSKP